MKIRKICASLGMKVTGSGNGTLKVVAPPFRSDIKAEIDVIEEVARVYGYDKIPSTIPAIVEQPVRVERAMGLRRAMREALSAMGVDEIMTYSLLGKRQISAAGLSPDAVVEVRNPLTSEQEAMRPSLIPGMLGAVAWNINRKSPDLRLYELGNVYKAVPGGEPREEMRLAIGIAGDKFSGWAGGTRPADFFELKGIFESLLRELGVRDVSFDPCDDPVFAPSQCARVSACGRAVAVMGLLGAKALGGFDIKEKVYMLEADADELMGLAAPGKSFSCLARFPSVSRDISIVVPAAARNADIILAIKAAAGPLLRSVALIDRYRGKQIPDDKVGLTYRLEYQDPSRTLEERTVSEAHENILRSLGEKLGAKLR
jgi:phenylalanyl-tRNA synthetase beta chain